MSVLSSISSFRLLKASRWLSQAPQQLGVVVLGLSAFSAIASPAAPKVTAANPNPKAAEVLFDDFSNYPDVKSLADGGWIVRSAVGHPGLPGAKWGHDQLSFVADLDNPKNRALRLRSATNGEGSNTQQAQICHQRKYLEGTYSARVRLSNQPVQGEDGDPVIQAFFVVSPLRFAFDPQFSEVDWEYLPNGGWGSPKTRLYGTSWQTVQIEPWSAFNEATEAAGHLDGWQVLTIQVSQGKTRFFLNGKQVAEHGGRNYPVVPMSINFNQWFSPGGVLPKSDTQRVYHLDVDWVYHARNRVLSDKDVLREVEQFRRHGVARTDTVPAAVPPLESPCDL